VSLTSPSARHNAQVKHNCFIKLKENVLLG